jgi:hypothetical protein
LKINSDISETQFTDTGKFDRMGKDRSKDTIKLLHIARWQRLSARPREH